MFDMTEDPNTELPYEQLRHLPNLPVTPGFGHTLQILRDPYGFQKKNRDAFGPVYRTKLLGTWRANLYGPDALELMLMDSDKLFSNEQGWSTTLGTMFPGGLMLRDFDDHRRHRRIMQAAFRSGAMTQYSARMADEMPGLVASLPVERSFDFYAAIKNLTLRMGSAIFLGLDVDDPRAARLNAAFLDEINAIISPIRRSLPFTPMAKGVASRRYLRAFLRDMIAERRSSDKEDFFSQMCRARDEDGTAWTDDEIVDHFNFLLMAAHDTTATGLTALIWGLGAHPDWQSRIAAEVAELADGPLDNAALESMVLTDQAFKEALRLVPPVPFLARRAVRSFEWNGIVFPAGAYVTAQAGPTMMSPELYTDPKRFDPDRFSPERAEHLSHRFAWVPYGGGAHKCIGLHFSVLQVKLFIAALFRTRRVDLPSGPDVHWKRLPIPRPKRGLTVRLEAAK